MTWIRLFLFAGLLNLCFIPVVNAEVITIAAEDDWIPYARNDGTGLANDIIKSAFESVGITVEYKVFPYSRVLYYLKEGEYAAGFNVPLDEKSRKNFILGKQPLFEADSAYYYNTDSPLKALTRDELEHGERIGVVRGYGYGDHYLNLVEKGLINEEEANSETCNLKKLAAGRIDATILYEKTAGILISRMHLDKRIKTAFNNEKTPIYLAFSKNHPAGKYYCDKFDEGMRKIKANGVYEKIMESYNTALKD